MSWASEIGSGTTATIRLPAAGSGATLAGAPTAASA